MASVSTSFSMPFWGALAGVAVLAAGVAYLAQPVAGGSSRLPASADAHSTSVERLADRGVADDEVAPPLHPQARSLFAVDTLGRLAVSAATLGALETATRRLPASPADADLAQLEADVRAGLPPIAADRAWSLARRYLAWREDDRALQRQARDRQWPARERFDASVALRRRHFDSVSAQELFGLQEARALYAFEVARILADGTLSEAQHTQQVMALRLGLPPALQAEESAIVFSLPMERQVVQMREQGIAENEITYMRRQYVDAEGGRSALDVENEQRALRQQAWELRHPAFVRQRDALREAEGLDERERREQLEQLLQQHVPPAERESARTYAGL
jgi:lipase chaperone LimK